MEDNENVVVETTENVVEQATEKLVEGNEVTTNEQIFQEEKVSEEKLYSQSELDVLVDKKVNEILPKKLERAKSKMQREYQEKYGHTENVLNAGLGTNSIEEATKKLADYYKENGVKIPEKTDFSERDISILANAEANEIINSGYDELVEETDRLAQKGAENMTQREKLLFQKLAEERKKQESIKELAKIGVKPDVLNDSEYKEFANNLNPSLSAKEKYELYLKFKPKTKVETIGSMKSTQKDKVKDYYTEEEISRMTLDDLNDPNVWEAVRKSMTGQN